MSLPFVKLNSSHLLIPVQPCHSGWRSFLFGECGSPKLSLLFAWLIHFILTCEAISFKVKKFLISDRQNPTLSLTFFLTNSSLTYLYHYVIQDKVVSYSWQIEVPNCNIFYTYITHAYLCSYVIQNKVVSYLGELRRKLQQCFSHSWARGGLQVDHHLGLRVAPKWVWQ